MKTARPTRRLKKRLVWRGRRRQRSSSTSRTTSRGTSRDSSASTASLPIPTLSCVVSGRRDAWLYLTLSSSIALVSLAMVAPRPSRPVLPATAMALMGTSIAISGGLSVCLHHGPARHFVTSEHFVSSAPVLSLELCVSVVVLVLWVAIVALLLFPPQTSTPLAIAYSPFTSVLVWNSNLYYSIMASFAICSYILADLSTKDTPHILLPWGYNFHHNRTHRYWILTFIATLAFLAFSWQNQQTQPCLPTTETITTTHSSCVQSTIPFLLASLQLVTILAYFALHWLSRLRKGLHLSKLGLALAFLSMICAIVNAAILTSDKTISCNLYLATWIDLALTIYLALTYFDAQLFPLTTMDNTCLLMHPRQFPLASASKQLPLTHKPIVKRRSTVSTKSSHPPSFDDDPRDAALESIVASHESSGPQLYLATNNDHTGSKSESDQDDYQQPKIRKTINNNKRYPPPPSPRTMPPPSSQRNMPSMPPPSSQRNMPSMPPPSSQRNMPSMPPPSSQRNMPSMPPPSSQRNMPSMPPPSSPPPSRPSMPPPRSTATITGRPDPISPTVPSANSKHSVQRQSLSNSNQANRIPVTQRKDMTSSTRQSVVHPHTTESLQSSMRSTMDLSTQRTNDVETSMPQANHPALPHISPTRYSLQASNRSILESNRSMHLSSHRIQAGPVPVDATGLPNPSTTIRESMRASSRSMHWSTLKDGDRTRQMPVKVSTTLPPPLHTYPPPPPPPPPQHSTSEAGLSFKNSSMLSLFADIPAPPLGTPLGQSEDSPETLEPPPNLSLDRQSLGGGSRNSSKAPTATVNSKQTNPSRSSFAHSASSTKSKRASLSRERSTPDHSRSASTGRKNNVSREMNSYSSDGMLTLSCESDSQHHSSGPPTLSASGQGEEEEDEEEEEDTVDEESIPGRPIKNVCRTPDNISVVSEPTIEGFGPHVGFIPSHSLEDPKKQLVMSAHLTNFSSRAINNRSTMSSVTDDFSNFTGVDQIVMDALRKAQEKQQLSMDHTKHTHPRHSPHSSRYIPHRASAGTNPQEYSRQSSHLSRGAVTAPDLSRRRASITKGEDGKSVHSFFSISGEEETNYTDDELTTAFAC